MRDASLQLPDGRTLAYTDIGDVASPCVLLFHGAPSSRLRPAYLEDEIVAGGIRVISPDRPAYGGSSPQPGRSLTDWPRDVEALADELGIDRFVVAGHSSGGPYAVACAAHLVDRVRGLVTLGGVTDMGWPGAWEGFFESEVELMRLPDEASVVARCEEWFGEDGSRFMSASGMDLPPADLPLYEDERVAAMLATSRAEAFRQGVTGYAQDVFVQRGAWPFDPELIQAATVVIHGQGDSLLPIAHARHTAAIVPGALLRVLAGHGHFTLLDQLPDVVAGFLG